MNRIDWIQKEKYIDYHVLKWPTSHLHPRERITVDAGLELKEKPAGGAASGAKPAQQEGMGLGIAETSAKTRWRSGGLGTDGMAQEGVQETACDKEGASVAENHSWRQSGTMERESSVAVQPVIPNETHSAVYSTAYRVGQAVQKIGGQIRGTAGRLRDVYQRQQKKETVPLRRNNKPMQEKERRGTRQVSRDEVLTMQVENHYLLDSYDKNGQYSVLGK